MSLRIQSINLLQAVECSIKPQPPRRVNEFADYPIIPGEGLPGCVVPEARGRRISVLVVDNHLTHLANPVVGHLRRQTGMIINYGQVRRWIGRAVVEGLFSELQVQLSRLASTTGSGPTDPAVNDPVGKAVRYRIRLTSLLDLLDILVGQHNAKRQRRLKMRTPNEVIAADCCGVAALSIVPRFEDDFVARPGVAVEIATRCVRGNRAKGRHPYVQLDEAEYTNDILRQSWHMVNKVTLTLHIRKDMRSVRAFLPDGTEFGQLEVCDHWKNSAHDRETRKEINRLYREGKMSERGKHPVTHFQNSLARNALLKAKHGKLSREIHRRQPGIDNGSVPLQHGCGPGPRAALDEVAWSAQLFRKRGAVTPMTAATGTGAPAAAYEPEEMARNIALSLDAIRHAQRLADDARAKEFAVDLSSPKVRKALARRHPMLDDGYIIETTQVQEFVDICYDFAAARKSGLYVVGSFRMGKSKAIERASAYLAERFPFFAILGFSAERKPASRSPSSAGRSSSRGITRSRKGSRWSGCSSATS